MSAHEESEIQGGKAAALYEKTADIENQSIRAKRAKTKEKDFNITTTRPTEIRRHDISDEELEMLVRDNTDGMSEKFWGFLGAGIAAVPSGGEALWNAYCKTPSISLTPIHVLEVMIIGTCLSCASVIYIISNNRSRRKTALVDVIRARRTE